MDSALEIRGNFRIFALASLNHGLALSLLRISAVLVTAITSTVPHFDMVHVGSYVSATSAFWAYFLTSPALLGPILFVVQLSFGEAVWSPRWYDYTMDIAPEGKEGIFSAIAGAPLFLAKLPTGLLSGVLLRQYCPEGKRCIEADRASCNAPDGNKLPDEGRQGPTGDCDNVIWLIIGLVTMASPLLVTTFQRWLRHSPDSEQARYRVVQLEDASLVGPARQQDTAAQHTISALRDAQLPIVPECGEDCHAEPGGENN